MRIIQCVKPTRIEAPTKSALISKLVANYGVNWSSTGKSHGYHVFGGNTWYGVNMEKRRRKMKLEKTKYKVSGLMGITNWNRSQVRPSHWVAWVYKLPSTVNVQQGSRTFTLTAA